MVLGVSFRANNSCQLPAEGSADGIDDEGGATCDDCGESKD